MVGMLGTRDPTRCRVLKVKRGEEFALPLFLPVFRPDFVQSALGAWNGPPHIVGCMVNAFFLYKDRDLRRRFREGLTLREYVAFDGLLCTDSGAFQGFRGRLLLSNSNIVSFQDAIRTDIGAPLDLVTPPGDKRTVATRKLEATQKRIREALALAEHCTIAGVQQGGRFLDLRHQSVVGLMEMGVEYLAIGSLVPFFNKNHDLTFVGAVLRDARCVAGPDIPMHIYGAGDPVELPFMVDLGADIFDSSSYAHFAEGAWYMTPYGALRDPGPLIAGEYRCACPVCAQSEIATEVFHDKAKLLLHNLWTICATLGQIGEAVNEGRLDAMLVEILERHTGWFPESALASSWEALHE